MNWEALANNALGAYVAVEQVRGAKAAQSGSQQNVVEQPQIQQVVPPQSQISNQAPQNNNQLLMIGGGVAALLVVILLMKK